MWQHKVQLVVQFGGQLFEDTTWQGLIILSVTLGSIVVGWIVFRLSECLSHRQSHKRWELEASTQKYREISTFRRGAVIRVLGMSLAIIVVLAGLTIGFNAAGFNFWTIAVGGGFVMWVVAKAFDVPLSNVAGYLLVSLTEKIEEDWYLQIPAMGAEGRVKSIHVLWVEMEFYDEPTKSIQEIHVPTISFLQYPIKRLFEKEREFNSRFKDPLDPNVNHRTGRLHPFQAAACSV